MKILKYIFEAIFFYILFFIIKILGIKLGRKICSFLFLKFGIFFRSKNIINENISNVFKNISKEDANIIINSMWENYGYILAEYMYLDKFRLNKFSNLHIQIKGKEILDNVLKSKKPSIFISGHFANFELMSMEITKKSIKLATIYRPLNNYFLNPFMEFLRKRYICKNQIKKGRAGVRDAMKFIDNGFSIALMIDQRVSEGLQINLFNRSAKTTTIPAQLVKKFGCKVAKISFAILGSIEFVCILNRQNKTIKVLPYKSSNLERHYKNFSS